MGRFKKDQSGFSSVEALLIVVIVGIVGFTGWYVWHAQKGASNTLKQINKSAQGTGLITKVKTNSNSGVTLKTYNSLLGGFSFKYPSDWTIDAFRGEQPVSDLNGQETVIHVIAPVDKQDPAVGQYSIYLTIIAKEKATLTIPNPYVSSGTATNLANGIYFWTNDLPGSSGEVDPNAGTPNCAASMIIGKGITAHYYGYPLNSGMYLEGEGGFCEEQKSTTNLTYAQQMSNQERIQGIEIFKSVVFN